MIYCPECGTANRDGSKFCNECGQRLGAFTRVKCPACSAMNPVQHAFCSACGGRLLPAAAKAEGAEEGPTIKGLSLPTKGSAPGLEVGAAAEEPLDLDEEVPAWLRELGARWHAESRASMDSAREDSEDLPDWLRDLRASLPDVQGLDSLEESEAPEWPVTMGPLAGANEKNEEVPLAEAEEYGVPDWLAELQDAAAAEAEETEEIPEAEQGEAPDWLAELRETAMAEGAEAKAPEAQEREIPGRLAEEIPSQETEASEGAEPEPPVKTETPEEPEIDEETSDWTAELETEGPAPAAVPEEIPERLTEMPLSAEAEIEEDRILEAEGGEPSDWLAAMGDLVEEEEHEGWEPPVPDEQATSLEGAVPDWLLHAQPSVEPPPAADQPAEETEVPDWLVPAEGGQEETLARAEIPDWLLDLKPAELREEGEPPEFEPVAREPIEETGLLAGLQGVLPVEMIIAQPRLVSEMEVLEAPAASDAPQVRLYAEIVGRPPQAEPKALTQPQQRQRMGLLPRSLIFVALIAVVTLPLLVEEPLWPRNPIASAPVQSLYEEIEALQKGERVLVAFDYDPSTSDEMNVLAQILVGHLMERGAGIVAVSLLPAGPPIAQTVLDEMATQHPDYAGAYGKRYVNLGYLPGQATAVRLLGQSLPMALPQDFQRTPLADLPLVAGADSIQDFALIVDLAASEQSVRWWVEQAATPYSVPLAGGVSASVIPLARPYYQTESRQLVGLAGGLPDAAAYATLRGDLEAQEGTLAARLDSLTGGHLVFILVLAIGSVIQFLRGSGGGR
jgi:hypothetical protein